MELTAVIRALEALKRPSRVRLYTDSQYVQKGISEWIHDWKRKRLDDRRQEAGEERRPVAASWTSWRAQHEIEWHWVRGHAGHAGERAGGRARQQGDTERVTSGRSSSTPRPPASTPSWATASSRSAASSSSAGASRERKFHAYLNPERDIDEGAAQVHGMTREDLRDKPQVRRGRGASSSTSCAAPSCSSTTPTSTSSSSTWSWRAPGWASSPSTSASVTDTLAFARELHPGKKNSLDALCERYFVNNANRTLHGALLDARLLAECYLAMTRGQESLVMELEAPARGRGGRGAAASTSPT